MGYTTDFSGSLRLNKQLTHEDYVFLKKLNETRRMARNVDPSYGVEGEFYVDGDDYRDSNIIDTNRPPSTQPGLWCQWAPTDDRWGIEWDGNEKFYSYVEWLQYIIDNILEPRGYKASGTIEWHGEDWNDIGRITVVDNVITVED